MLRPYGDDRPPPVAHIVPSLVPGACGVGDYAVEIARGLWAQGVASRFIVCGVELADRASENDPRGPFPMTTFTRDLETNLTRLLESSAIDTLLLHYTGNGYDPAGSPRWLAAALRRYVGRPGVRLVTVFHETWQERAILSRRLYRPFFQRRVVRSICRLSSIVVTNTRRRAAELSRYHPAGCDCLPVFSNVGEQIEGIDKDPSLAVVFGLPNRRQKTWDALARDTALLDRLQVTAIADIGAPGAAVPAPLAPLATCHGSLSSREVSALLSRAATAFLFYDNAELTKSGILAAFAAHKLCVVNLCDANREGGSGDLAPGTHYLLASDLGADRRVDPRAIAAALSDWYAPHGLHETVAMFRRLLT